ncbi:MAG: hypothetical protein ACYC3I_04010 [Gemmataceae bacterium]
MKALVSGEWFDDFLAGFTAYYLTSLPVFLGVLFGVDFPHPAEVPSSPRPDFVSACFHFDASHYLEIVREGSSYDPAQRSVVAFFPAYPLLSRMVGQVAGLSPEESLLLMAQASLLGAFVLLSRYVHVRRPEATAEQRGGVLAVFGLWPLENSS